MEPCKGWKMYAKALKSKDTSLTAETSIHCRKMMR